jgi:uncharacterized protein
MRASALCATALLLLLGLSGCQRHMIYFPARASAEALERDASRHGLQPWRDSSGAFAGWRTPAGDDRGAASSAVVVFHGNAGHALMRTYFVRGFAAMPGAVDWQVFLFEYPGFGARSGTPGEAAILRAAEAALLEVRAQGFSRVYLVGESLGSGVASHLAGRHPEHVSGVLLLTPFTSLADVAAHHYPRFLVALLLRERYDNVSSLQHYGGPVAILVAENDEVVPAELGRRLYEGYRGPKKLWIQSGRTHNTLSYEPGAPWWQELAEFLQQHSHPTNGPNPSPPAP